MSLLFSRAGLSDLTEMCIAELLSGLQSSDRYSALTIAYVLQRTCLHIEYSTSSFVYLQLCERQRVSLVVAVDAEDGFRKL